jgi:TolB-like protein
MRHVLSAAWMVSTALALAPAPPAIAYEQQVQQLSHDLAAQLGARSAKKVAVVDFTDLRGDVNELGRFLAEELSVALNQAAEGFQVIDRTRLQVVFAEHRLGASGLIAPEDAKRLGQLVGADVLVSATMTPFGESVRLSVKALETETAALMASARGDVPRTGAIEDLLGRGMGERRVGVSDRTAAGEKRAEAVKAKGFAFELQGCELSGATVECVVIVQNQLADRVLTMSGRSRLFDDLGNEYSPSRLQIANETWDRFWQVIQKSVLQEVPTPLILTFEGVSASAGRVALLSLALRAEDIDFSAQFRDFPFSSSLP